MPGALDNIVSPSAPPAYLQAKVRLYERLGNYLRGGGVLVELGCGDGAALDHLRSRYRLAIGIDGSLGRFRTRTQPPARWNMVVADLNQHVPLHSDSADAVFLNQVIEHLADPVRLAAEVRRVLRREGVALITTPNVRYVRHLWNLVVRGRGPRTGDQIQIDGAWDNGHIHYFTHSDLREVFLQAGFRTVQSLALINDRGSLGWARNLLSRNAASYLVREFMSGNILLLAFR